MKKKYAVILILAVILLSATGCSSKKTPPLTPKEPVFAEGTVKISGENVSCSAGDIIDYVITMDENPGIYCVLFALNYDDTKLELLSHESGSAIPLTTTAQYITDNPYSFIFENDDLGENGKETGTLVTVKFQVKEDAAGTIPIILEDFDSVNVEGQYVNVEHENGSITIN